MNKKNSMLAVVALAIGSLTAFGQAPAAPAAGAPAAAGGARGGGGGGGGRGGGGLPGQTAEQTAAITEMNAGLMAQNTAVTDARAELATATFAEPMNKGAITAAVEKVRTAELALANARADAFAKLQMSPNKLTDEQLKAPGLVAALSGGGGGGARGGGGGGGGRGGAAAGAAGGAAAPAAGGAAPAAGARAGRGQ